jgi:hypothetical protein
MKIACVLACLVALLLSGCGDSRWFRAFELGENNFDSEALQVIGEDAGLRLPAGTRGLNFRYEPPIDPSFVARLEIRPEHLDALKNQIAAIKEDDPNGFRKYQNGSPGSLSKTTAWWKPPEAGAIIDRDWFKGTVYTRALLAREGEKIILYIDYNVR